MHGLTPRGALTFYHGDVVRRMRSSAGQEVESSPQDLTLLLMAREGDHDACEELLARHGPSMVRTVWRILGRYGQSEADDVIQEAFIAALTTSALPTKDVGSWLRAIAVRKALDSLRQTSRRAESELPMVDPIDTGLLQANPEHILDVLTVRKLLDQLSALDRAVLTLVDLEGASTAEAAKVTGLTRVAVKLRASRARRKLARLVREHQA